MMIKPFLMNNEIKLNTDIGFTTRIIGKYYRSGQYFFPGISLTYLNWNKDQEETESQVSAVYLSLKLLLAYNYQQLYENHSINQEAYIQNITKVLSNHLNHLKRTDAKGYEYIYRLFRVVQIPAGEMEKEKLQVMLEEQLRCYSGKYQTAEKQLTGMNRELLESIKQVRKASGFKHFSRMEENKAGLDIFGENSSLGTSKLTSRLTSKLPDDVRDMNFSKGILKKSEQMNTLLRTDRYGKKQEASSTESDFIADPIDDKDKLYQTELFINDSSILVDLHEHNLEDKWNQNPQNKHTADSLDRQSKDIIENLKLQSKDAAENLNRQSWITAENLDRKSKDTAENLDRISKDTAENLNRKSKDTAENLNRQSKDTTKNLDRQGKYSAENLMDTKVILTDHKFIFHKEKFIKLLLNDPLDSELLLKTLRKDPALKEKLKEISNEKPISQGYAQELAQLVAWISRSSKENMELFILTLEMQLPELYKKIKDIKLLEQVEDKNRINPPSVKSANTDKDIDYNHTVQMVDTNIKSISEAFTEKILTRLWEKLENEDFISVKIRKEISTVHEKKTITDNYSNDLVKSKSIGADKSNKFMRVASGQEVRWNTVRADESGNMENRQDTGVHAGKDIEPDETVSTGLDAETDIEPNIRSTRRHYAGQNRNQLIEQDEKQNTEQDEKLITEQDEKQNIEQDEKQIIKQDENRNSGRVANLDAGINISSDIREAFSVSSSEVVEKTTQANENIRVLLQDITSAVVSEEQFNIVSDFNLLSDKAISELKNSIMGSIPDLIVQNITTVNMFEQRNIHEELTEYCSYTNGESDSVTDPIAKDLIKEELTKNLKEPVTSSIMNQIRNLIDRYEVKQKESLEQYLSEFLEMDTAVELNSSSNQLNSVQLLTAFQTGRADFMSAHRIGLWQKRNKGLKSLLTDIRLSSDIFKRQLIRVLMSADFNKNKKLLITLHQSEWFQDIDENPMLPENSLPINQNFNNTIELVYLIRKADDQQLREIVKHVFTNSNYQYETMAGSLQKGYPISSINTYLRKLISKEQVKQQKELLVQLILASSKQIKEQLTTFFSESFSDDLRILINRMNNDSSDSKRVLAFKEELLGLVETMEFNQVSEVYQNLLVNHKLDEILPDEYNAIHRLDRGKLVKTFQQKSLPELYDRFEMSSIKRFRQRQLVKQYNNYWKEVLIRLICTGDSKANEEILKQLQLIYTNAIQPSMIIDQKNSKEYIKAIIKEEFLDIKDINDYKEENGRETNTHMIASMNTDSLSADAKRIDSFDSETLNPESLHSEAFRKDGLNTNGLSAGTFNTGSLILHSLSTESKGIDSARSVSIDLTSINSASKNSGLTSTELTSSKSTSTKSINSGQISTQLINSGSTSSELISTGSTSSESTSSESKSTGLTTSESISTGSINLGLTSSELISTGVINLGPTSSELIGTGSTSSESTSSESISSGTIVSESVHTGSISSASISTHQVSTDPINHDFIGSNSIDIDSNSFQSNCKEAFINEFRSMDPNLKEKFIRELSNHNDLDPELIVRTLLQETPYLQELFYHEPQLYAELTDNISDIGTKLMIAGDGRTLNFDKIFGSMGWERFDNGLNGNTASSYLVYLIRKSEEGLLEQIAEVIGQHPVYARKLTKVQELLRDIITEKVRGLSVNITREVELFQSSILRNKQQLEQKRVITELVSRQQLLAIVLKSTMVEQTSLIHFIDSHHAFTNTRDKSITTYQTLLQSNKEQEYLIKILQEADEQELYHFLRLYRTETIRHNTMAEQYKRIFGLGANNLLQQRRSNINLGQQGLRLAQIFKPLLVRSLVGKKSKELFEQNVLLQRNLDEDIKEEENFLQNTTVRTAADPLISAGSFQNRLLYRQEQHTQVKEETVKKLVKDTILTDNQISYYHNRGTEALQEMKSQRQELNNMKDKLQQQSCLVDEIKRQLAAGVNTGNNLDVNQVSKDVMKIMQQQIMVAKLRKGLD